MLAGDAGRAQALIEESGRRFPNDTLVNSVWLPTVRAAIEVRRDNSAKAIQELQAAMCCELGRDASFLPIYHRGQAYLRAGKGTEAAAEFQKILDHRGIDATSPHYALAHLGLARASALASDTSKSRKAYQDFFALTKDADPDIPILQQARAEYAKLK